MANHTFNASRTCPMCSASFKEAEAQAAYAPVVVVSCPKCQQLLWRPGSDEDSALFLFDPDADADGL